MGSFRQDEVDGRFSVGVEDVDSSVVGVHIGNCSPREFLATEIPDRTCVREISARS